MLRNKGCRAIYVRYFLRWEKPQRLDGGLCDGYLASSKPFSSQRLHSQAGKHGYVWIHSNSEINTIFPDTQECRELYWSGDTVKCLLDLHVQYLHVWCPLKLTANRAYQQSDLSTFCLFPLMSRFPFWCYSVLLLLFCCFFSTQWSFCEWFRHHQAD